METQNTLFPVFLKLEKMAVLLVGGGNVALEKLQAIYANSPNTKITIVAKELNQELLNFLHEKSTIKVIQKAYEKSDLKGFQIVISAVADVQLSAEIARDAEQEGIFNNAADKPELCDYYLGSIVQKGNLKIAISTNGKSPTMAKRIKEALNDVFPDETEEVLDRLYAIRTQLKGDFSEKIKVLNEITSSFTEKNKQEKKVLSRVKKASLYSLVILLIMLLGHWTFSYVPFSSLRELAMDTYANLDDNFYMYLLAGFTAQLIDGALGMAYGVSVTTFLLSLGIPTITPAVASASMHASEIITTGSSSLIYMRFKNINFKLFRALVWPGVIGTICGVLAVSFVSKEYFSIIKPIVSLYTLSLGAIIIYRVFRKPVKRKKITKIYPVAFLGGFLDSVGGGGWGPIVTSSLLAGGRHLRYAVGSAHMAKFFVAVVSTICFFFLLGISHWQIIFGLIVGGVVAAPISIYFSNKIPIKKGLILVGTLIIIISLRTLIKSIV
jgi:siroheme synthase-like protein